MHEAQTMPTVILVIDDKSDPTDPRRARTPDFICVEWAWRTMAYTIRLPLQLDGVNDMEGRKFDFWFEWLKEAAASGKDTKVTVLVDWSSSTSAIGLAKPQTQKSYAGTLCKTGDMAPRLVSGNSSLFEFDLCDARSAETISAPVSAPTA